MTSQELQAIFDVSRNGANNFFRHPLARRFRYSDGVKEVAEKAGAYWLLDLIGTEVVDKYIAECVDGTAGLGVLKVYVKDSKARITLDVDDGAPPIYARKVDFTDFPEGTWTFYLGCDDGTYATLILPSEY